MYYDIMYIKKGCVFLIRKSAVEEFIGNKNFDIRLSNNGRWIDQKCTPDVLQIISSTIVEFIESDEKMFFFTSDIWNSEFSKDEVREIFKKPGTDSYQAKNEFDKFFQQPLKLLANSGILKEKKVGNKIQFEVLEEEILFYISLSDKNALDFLITYINKVLKDSGIQSYFSCFFEKQTRENFLRMKNHFEQFLITNTNINTNVEARRIFTKVLNPVAYSMNSKGTIRGYLSKDIITRDVLMYNRPNFRDVNLEKPKGITRKEYIVEYNKLSNKKLTNYKSIQAKKMVKFFNLNEQNGVSEYDSNEKASHMHHIFMASEFPELSGHVENIIPLSPNEHLQKAHPNNTNIVDYNFQKELLLTRLKTIREYEDKLKSDSIYSMVEFIKILSVGFDSIEIKDINPNDYQSIEKAILIHFTKK